MLSFVVGPRTTRRELANTDLQAKNREDLEYHWQMDE